MIHPHTYIHPNAKVATNVKIDPFTVIHQNVEIGEGTWIGSNVTIMEGARIGKNCRIFPGAVLSAIPQDLKFRPDAFIRTLDLYRDLVAANPAQLTLLPETALPAFLDQLPPIISTN